MKTVDCGTATDRETMTSLTKDGVQFSIDVYTRYSVNCTSDESVQQLLDAVSPDDGTTDIGGKQVFETFARPILGETIREAVSPHVANDINTDREAILGTVPQTFVDRMAKQTPAFIVIQEVNLSNMDFPDELEQANTGRAQQAILRDKAIAERGKVETETAMAQEALSRQQGKVEAAKIDEIGAALQRNPQYLQYMLQVQMPGIYDKADRQSNMVIAGPDPTLFVTPKPSAAGK